MRALIVLLCLLPSIAVADQCIYNKKSVADDAAKRLQKVTFYRSYCKPCNNTEAGKVTIDGPVTVKKMDETSKDEANWGVTVNKDEIDLAYAYIGTEPGGLKNLGLLAKCEGDELVETIPPSVTMP